MECTLLCPAVAHATVLTPTNLLDKRSHHTRRREVAVVPLVRASTSATFDRYGVRGVVDYVVKKGVLHITITAQTFILT